MRISDWSSDVCSSDLIVGSGAAGLAAAMAAANAGQQVLLVEADAELGGGLLSERAEVEGQIGRASCRGRVGQDVSISVVAVTLTKKHQEEWLVSQMCQQYQNYDTTQTIPHKPK